mgnify:CR=1 FL=1
MADITENQQIKYEKLKQYILHFAKKKQGKVMDYLHIIDMHLTQLVRMPWNYLLKIHILY